MIAPLFALFAIGLIALSKVDKKTSSAPTGGGGYAPGVPGGGGGTVPIPVPGTGAPSPTAFVSCEAATAGLPEPLRSNVNAAIATGTDPAKLRELAVTLDAAAAMYAAPIGPSAAAAAACVRRRADEIEKKAPLSGWGGVAPPKYFGIVDRGGVVDPYGAGGVPSGGDGSGGFGS
jgi:hypothetical protein